MVYGFPKVEEHKGVYEGCALSKYVKQKFPKGKACKRASYPMHLVYDDIYGPM